MSDVSQYPQNNDASEEVSQVEAVAQVLEEDLSVETDEMRDRHLEMIDAAQTSAELAFDFARELASAKTPSELMVLCMTHAQKQLTVASEQTLEPAEHSSKMGAANVYIIARSSGSHGHDSIDDFTVEDDAGQLLGTFDTQMEAILWSKENGHVAQVARDGNRRDKKNPDHWRCF